jgi:CRP/FNR family cyclic AMP-dependent transcriptional regulator
MRVVPGLHSWIHELPERVRANVVGAARPRAVGNGEAVYALGEKSDACYILQTGRVRICNVTDAGKEYSLGEFLPGDCMGEIGLIDGLPRSNSAIACEKSEVLVLRRGDFERLYQAHPEVAQSLNRFFAYRLRYTLMLAEEAGALSLSRRLGRLLSRLAHSTGVPQEDSGILIKNASQESLGHMLGATRQAVSQELKAMERSGLLEVRYGKILIKDLPTLLSEVDSLIGGEGVVPGYAPIVDRS